MTIGAEEKAGEESPAFLVWNALVMRDRSVQNSVSKLPKSSRFSKKP
jgi:hypothetical protein